MEREVIEEEAKRLDEAYLVNGDASNNQDHQAEEKNHP
jgi:hypothetical protein